MANYVVAHKANGVVVEVQYAENVPREPFDATQFNAAIKGLQQVSNGPQYAIWRRAGYIGRFGGRNVQAPAWQATDKADLWRDPATGNLAIRKVARNGGFYHRVVRNADLA